MKAAGRARRRPAAADRNAEALLRRRGASPRVRECACSEGTRKPEDASPHRTPRSRRQALCLCGSPFLLAYALGTRSRFLPGLAGALLLTVGLQAQSPVFNPFLEMITFGPWLASRIVASRRRLTGQLAARYRQLAAER